MKGVMQKSKILQMPKTELMSDTDDDGGESVVECDKGNEFLKTLVAEYLSEDNTSSVAASELSLTI